MTHQGGLLAATTLFRAGNFFLLLYGIMLLLHLALASKARKLQGLTI